MFFHCCVLLYCFLVDQQFFVNVHIINNYIQAENGLGDVLSTSRALDTKLT